MPCMKQSLILLFFFFTGTLHSTFAQCPVTINTFPYTEGFQFNNGGWIAGGVNSDWDWGLPNKSFINGAIGASNCWVTGGLTGSFYAFGQRSFVESPCFDFTNVAHPFVSMNIYWECENVYDGATFQYSLNGGATWTNVGSVNDPVDCLNQNWFNQANINALSTLANPREGWAGTITPTVGACNGGMGSGAWVTASHCMSNLAGEPSVKFRFAFGAGTLCNAYDGFAFDDIYIGEAPPNMADFTFNCTGTPLEYQFIDISAQCPSTYSWDFGDPASGASNTSNQQNPTHIFSAPGSYTVVLSVTGPCNAPSTIVQIISTLEISSIISPTTCNNTTNGQINSTLLNTFGTINYTILPSGNTNTTGTFTGLAPGTYTISATDFLGCVMTSTEVVSSPPPIQFTAVNAMPISCNGLQNGSITSSASGGTGVLNYTLQPGNINNSSGIFNSLGGGTYTITATDANNCTQTTLATISNPAVLVISQAQKNDVSCFGAANGSINISSNGGTGTKNYQIQPGGNTNSSGNFQNLTANNYTIIVSDANGCTVSTVLNITEPTPILINGINVQQPICNPTNSGTLLIDATGGNFPLSFSIGGAFGSSNSFTGLAPGTYIVTVSDTKGCTVTSTVVLQNPPTPTIVNATIDPIFCFGGITNVRVDVNSTIGVLNYILQPNNLQSNNGVFSNISAGTYTAVVTDINSCTSSYIFTIDQPAALLLEQLNFTSDSCGLNYLGTLTAIASGGVGPYTYTLQPGNNTNANGKFPISQAGNYSVTAIDNNGCFVSNTKTVIDKPCCGDVFIPNAFTPNGDLKNDELRLLNTAGIQLEDFSIYDRWGNIVFLTRTKEIGWEGNVKGEKAEVGTYYYQLRYRCDGSSKLIVVSGDIMLLR